MNYLLDLGIWGSVFAVPTQIVDKHLKLCGAAQLKVLLTLLRHSGEGMALEALAASLNLTTADTQDALNYWLQCGVLRAQDTGDATQLLPAERPAAPATPVVPVVPAPSPVPAAPAEPDAPPSGGSGPSRVSASPQQRPRPLEVQQLVQRDPHLKALLEEAEAQLCKPLTTSDVATLVSLYDWAGVPADVLLTVICYCKSIEKPNLRYIEKTAVSWMEHGIDSLEKAEVYMNETLKTDAQTRLVMEAFGLPGRSLSTKEAAFVRQWFNDYHFDIPLIRLAYERAVDRTGKVNFPYIGKILTTWYEKNVKTPEDAARADEAFSRAQGRPQQDSSYNIDEIEERLLRGSPKLV